MTSWIPLALITAIALATADLLSKRALKETDTFVVVWVREGYALIFLLPLFFFIPFPRLGERFFITVAMMVPLEVLSLILYMKAIKLSPLSLTVPFMALTPVFIIIIAFIFLGEWPSGSGIAGIILIAAGAYLLNAGAATGGLLGPLRAIGREPGSVLMIIVAFIYSITATLGKVAIQQSSPVFFGLFYPLVLTIVLTVFMASIGRLKLVFSRPKVFIPIGLCTSIMVLTHFMALNLTQVAYMISVKRTSLIFSVIYGRIFFNELNLRERLLGSVVMVAGVILIIAL